MVLLVIVGVAFLSGAPVFVVMGAVAMVLFWHDGTPGRGGARGDVPPGVVGDAAGDPAAHHRRLRAGRGRRGEALVKAYKGFFGWMPGGVAMMATVVCAVFTTFTGGSGVTILALGGLLAADAQGRGVPRGLQHGPGHRLGLAGAAVSAVAAGDPLLGGGLGAGGAPLSRWAGAGPADDGNGGGVRRLHGRAAQDRPAEVQAEGRRAGACGTRSGTWGCRSS